MSTLKHKCPRCKYGMLEVEHFLGRKVIQSLKTLEIANEYDLHLDTYVVCVFCYLSIGLHGVIVVNAEEIAESAGISLEGAIRIKNLVTDPAVRKGLESVRNDLKKSIEKEA